MKKIFLIILIVFHFLIGKAQQEIQSSQFMLNPFLLNAAYSSVDDNTDLKVGYRSQWVGIEGAPETSYMSLHGPIGKPRWGRTHPGDFHNWHGAGVVMIQDNIGAYRNIRLNANYSYNLKLTSGTEFGYNHHDGLRFALGVFVGMNQFNIDTDILSKSKKQGSGNIMNNNTVIDPAYLALSDDWTHASIDLSFGGMLYYEDAFYLGGSITQILENDIALGIDARFSRHYFITGLTKLEVSEEFYVIPSAILKMVSGAPLSWNANIRLDWKDNYYAGIGYRSSDAIILMLGTQIRWGEEIKNFRVSKNRYMMYLYYSYDYTVSALGNNDNLQFSRGAHEITLGFLLPPRFKERNAEDTWKDK